MSVFRTNVTNLFPAHKSASTMTIKYLGSQRLFGALITLLLALFLSHFATAQIGTDNSFGINGRFQYNEPGTNEEIVAVFEQPDGKVIAVGQTNYDPDEANNSRIFVFRLNSNGTTDNSYVPGGKVYIDTPNSTDVAYAAILQSDGKILIAGYQGSYQGTVYRLNTNGTLDNTFGTGGKSVIGSESVYQFRNIKLQSDGKIVVSGHSFIDSRFSYLIARFNTNGQLDNTFNIKGYNKFRTSSSSTEEDNGAGYGLAIQSDGKILSCGYDEKENGTVVRVTSSGVLDITFSNDGKHVIDFDKKMYLYSVLALSAGKILLGGTYEYLSSTPVAQIIQLFENGNFDSSFAGNGLGWYGNDSGVGYEMALQCDGKILIGGSNYLTRVNPDGTVDQSFANNGHLNFTFDYYPSAQTLSLGKNKIYLAGYYYHQSSFSDQGGFVLRLNNDINCNTTPTEDIERDISVKLYPNPVRDRLTLQIGDETEVVDISLTDHLGRLVLSNNQFYSSGSVMQCDVSLLPPGTYYAVVTTALGRRAMPVVKM